MVGAPEIRRAASLAALASFFFVGLWSSRTGGNGEIARDLIPSVLATWLIALVVWRVARRFHPEDARPYLLGLLAVIWCALAASFSFLFSRLLGPSVLSATGLAITWTILSALLGWAVLAAKGSADRLAEAAEFAALIAFVFSLTNLAFANRTIPQPGVVWTDARQARVPDVYVIVLDMHGSGAWLRAEYGYDNQPFEDSLRSLGFIVPRAARANYAHTQLSLPSVLEGRLIHDDPAFVQSPVSALPAFVGNSALWPAVRAQGYRVVSFASTYVATRELSTADLVIRPRSSARVPLAETFRLNSALVAFLNVGRCNDAECGSSITTPFPTETAEAIAWKFRTLSTLPDSAGPIWAFVHVLAPHEPYLYEQDCSSRKPWWPLLPTEHGVEDSVRVAYPAQVHCIDSLVLDAVTVLVTRSQTPPVILITGDHGHGRVGIDVMRGITFEYNQLSANQIGERMSVFTALRLPGADTLLSDEMSLVEVLPTIRRVLWKDSTPVHRDAPSYWSPYQRLRDFTEVPRSLLLPPARDSTR